MSGVVAEIERKLARRRATQHADEVPDLRLSTMTHVVWAPERWLARARRVLAGLAERHPARTIFIVPVGGKRSSVEATVAVRDFALGSGFEVLSEIVEVRLGGAAAEHPASIVLPLLISDLPAFCRWRGEPDWSGRALPELADVCDRLVVDSREWPHPRPRYSDLAQLFETAAVSDLAWRRGLPWRARLAEQWPEIGRSRSVEIAGPPADSALLEGWLRSRLRRPPAVKVVALRQSELPIERVSLDGAPVPAPTAAPLSGSDCLSAELDVLVRDPIYEAAARAV